MPRSQRRVLQNSNLVQRINSQLSQQRSLPQDQNIKQTRWNKAPKKRCHCSHSVHCLSTCSLRCPLEVHGVATTKKALQGEGESKTEDVCVKTGCQFGS
nr:uncharacterized protein sb:cb288 isoform X2 [Pseudochaenichthys georgianus]